LTTDPDPRLLIGDTFETAYSLFSDQSPATRPYEMYVTGEGTTLGNSESITRVIDTFLDDLQYIVGDGQGPREMKFTVWVTGDDDRVLGRAERELMEVLYRPTLAFWRPPRAIAPWAVFEVAASALAIGDLGENDLEETLLQRKYVISLTCGAWVRSMNEEVATLPAGADVEEVLNAGSETGAAVSGNYITAAMDDASGDLVVTYAPTGVPPEGRPRIGRIVFTGFTFDASVTPLLVLDATFVSGPLVDSQSVMVSSSGGSTANLTVESVVPTDDDGGYRIYYRVPAGVWDSVTFQYEWLGPFLLPGAEYVYISLTAIDAGASIGTLRQKMFSFDVKGAVDARGSIEVSNDAPLGTCLTYSFTDPNGTYMPALGPWRVSYSTSDRTSDVNTTSGWHDQIENGDETIYVMPLATLPDGTYDIVARATTADSDGGHPVVTAEVYQNSIPLLVVDPSFTPSIAFDAGRYHYYVIGQITLPLLKVSADSDARLLIRVKNLTSGQAPVIDDGYLLNIDIGAYTIVDCGGTPADDPDAAHANFLALESPTFDWPAQSIVVGDRDSTPSHHASPGSKVHALGRHQLEPGRNRVLVVTDAVDPAAVARYYPRGHTNPEG